jgi:hypothetical protein
VSPGVTLVDAALAALAAPVLLASAYLLLLALFSARPRPPPPSPPHLRFDVVVPAHDEEAGIGATVRSLLAMDYPPELRRVVVVADNCSDATAERAGEAGARVLVRRDPERRGKGFALALAFERSLAEGLADAVAVVDADTSVSPNLLSAFAARLDAGDAVVQADYRVRNPDASWRTRLLAIAFALFNTVRGLGRDRLGCSAGLRGNGMCFASRVLREVPHQAFSIVEDLEYGIRLGLAGHRVRYAAEAVVRGDMAEGAEASRVQRSRWEGGRARIARQWAGPLLWRGLRARDRVLLELGLDLAVPPLAYLAAAAAAGSAAAGLASALAGRPLASLVPWLASLACLCLYLARGWQLSGTGLRGLLGLARAPAYLAWKVGLLLRRAGAGQVWARTPRERRP